MSSRLNFSCLTWGVLTGILVAFFVGVASAADITWTGGRSEYWSSQYNWNPNTIPTQTDRAIISQGVSRMDLGSGTYDTAMGKHLYQTNSNVYLTGTGQFRSTDTPQEGYTYRWDYYNGMEIGTVNGANVSIVQDSGTFFSGYLALGTNKYNSTAAINASYTMTGGTYYSAGTVLATGQNVNATMSISGSAKADLNCMIAGADKGTATLNITGGTITSTNAYIPNYGNHGITLGVNGGKGTMTFSGTANAKAQTYTVGGYTGYENSGGTGIANHGGNAVFETKALVIGDYGATGTVNLSTGKLWATNDAKIGVGAGSGTLNQSCGGLFQVGPFANVVVMSPPGGLDGGSIAPLASVDYKIANLFIGYDLMSQGQAVYNMPCGNYLCYGDTYVGYMSGLSPDYTGTLAQWNISKSAIVDIKRDDNTSQGGNLIIGNPDNVAGVNLVGLTKSEVNIVNGGKVSVVGNVTGYTNQSFLNIYGSKSDIQFGTLLQPSTTPGQLDINFTLDSYGASTIKAGTADLSNSPLMDVNIPGFISLKTDQTTLLQTNSLITPASNTNTLWKDNTPYQFKNNLSYTGANGSAVIIQMDHAGIDAINTPWEGIVGVYEIFRTDDPLRVNGTVSGALELHGEYTYLQAFFKGVEGKTYADGTPMLTVLMNYLNDAVVETGVHFGALTSDSLLLTGPYLNDDGYAWFGWDLSGFNSTYASYLGPGGVTLYQFNAVPEPATWVMILLAGPAVFFLRRHTRRV